MILLDIDCGLCRSTAFLYQLNKLLGENLCIMFNALNLDVGIRVVWVSTYAFYNMFSLYGFNKKKGGINVITMP